MDVINYILGYENLKVYQNTDMFNFSLDSVLLPNFVTLNKKIINILDIGTGNAIIPIIMATKTNALIDAVEIQEDVFKLGLKSIIMNNLQDQVSIKNMDINEFSKSCNTDTYDTITCNPPFFKVKEDAHLSTSVYKKIARHEVNLNLEDIMGIAKKLLKNNGNIALVHRTDRLIDIIEIMRKYNIEPKRIQFVYPKINKESNILLIEGTKNGKPGIKILDPIYAHNSNGDYSNQVIEYLK